MLDTWRANLGVIGLALALVVPLVACGNSDGNGGDGDLGWDPTAPPTGGSGGSSNLAAVPLTQSNVDKVDLLFMIDNSISMSDKQALLADAVPVLVQRLTDPVCFDDGGNPTGGTASTGCQPGSAPEFPPMTDIHIGIVTSSLGSHGGDVCVPNPADVPPRTLNDSAQLLPSVRTNLYSYQNRGFLVWDPRTDRPAVDPHPGLSTRETSVAEFVTEFSNHVQSVGERGCGYEASLEAWYRFLDRSRADPRRHDFEQL